MFYAITWINKPANPDMRPYKIGPRLVRRRGNKLVWLSGGYCDWPQNAKIIKTYRQCNPDKALIAFYCDYPPKKSKPIVSAGWIATDGAFYPCKSWEHDALAVRLTAVRYGSLDGDVRLMREGWIRLYEYGLVGLDGELSQAQRDILFDLSELDGGEKWLHHLRMALELRSSEV